MSALATRPRLQRRHALMMLAVGLLLEFAAGLSLPARAAPGGLDPTFDFDGRVTTHLSDDNDIATGVAVQPNGRIVLAGGSTGQFAIVRYLSDGGLDTSFAGDGIQITPVGPGTSVANAVAIDPDGRIVAAGNTDGGHFAVVRYALDGSLDTTFSGDGKQSTDIGGFGGAAWAMAVQPDGKIILAGSVFIPPRNHFALARFSSDGTLDTGFSDDGVVTTAIVEGIGDESSARAVIVQPDGKIVAVGGCSVGTSRPLCAARYGSDGDLDSSFAGDGTLTSDVGLSGVSAALQSDGKIVVVGSSFFNGVDSDYGVARLNADGSVDTSFSGDGIQSTHVGDREDRVTSVALQSDGKIVAAGFTAGDTALDFAIVRYEPDGDLDPAFSGDGIQTAGIGSGNDEGNAVALQEDGKIVVGGYSARTTDDYDFSAIRFFADPTTTPFDTPAVVRGNVWHLSNGYQGVTDKTFAFGRATDAPIAGDWDGEGDTTPGVVRGNVWYLNNDFDATHDETLAFGRATDHPIVGDWEGDGGSSLGVVRGNVWYLRRESSGLILSFAYGRSTDIQIAGAWSG